VTGVHQGTLPERGGGLTGLRGEKLFHEKVGPMCVTGWKHKGGGKDVRKKETREIR